MIIEKESEKEREQKRKKEGCSRDRKRKKEKKNPAFSFKMIALIPSSLRETGVRSFSYLGKI